MAEEAEGKVRCLRPEYRVPAYGAALPKQGALAIEAKAKAADRRWPKDEPAQFVALRAALRDGPIAAREIARRFKGTPRGDRLPRMLQTLVALGQARALDGGRFTA